MRQSKKEIKDKEVIVQLLQSVHVGRLGTAGADGYPMIKPLNFAYTDGKLYIHSARDGEKIDDIKRDNRVCFEADLPIALVRSQGSPCKAEFLYRSVIIRGRAHIVEDRRERLFGLGLLMLKYQPEGGYGDFPEDKLALTAVIRIDVEEMTGKEDLGKDRLRQEALTALEGKASLPLILVRE